MGFVLDDQVIDHLVRANATTLFRTATNAPDSNVLVQALGPYALFARQQAPAYWADPAAQPVAPCTLSIPQPAATMYDFSAETRLPPHFQELAPRPARAGGARPSPSAGPSIYPALSPASALDPAAAAAAQACEDASPGPVPMETEGPGSPAAEPALAAGRRRIMRGSATRSRWTKCALSHLTILAPHASMRLWRRRMAAAGHPHLSRAGL